MAGKAVRDWLASWPTLKRFEAHGVIKEPVEGKWNFYRQVQEAIGEMPRYLSKGARISRSAEIVGDVIIESGVQIFPNSFVEGPVFIGRESIIGNCALVRAGTFLSRRSLLGNHCYCTSSVVAPDVRIAHFCGISRSLLERNCYLSAFVITATMRPDQRAIEIPGLTYDEFPTKAGALIGEATYIAPHVVIGPGVCVGDHCVVGSFAVVMRDLPSRKKFVSAPQSFVEDANLAIKPRRGRMRVSFGISRRR